jgi:hypothetical protein
VITIEFDPREIPANVDLSYASRRLRKALGRDILGLSSNGTTIFIHASRPLSASELDNARKILQAKKPAPPRGALVFASWDDFLDFLASRGIEATPGDDGIVVTVSTPPVERVP